MSAPQTLTPSDDVKLEQLLTRMRSDGSIIREKAKALLEHLGLPELFAQLTDPDAPRGQKLEALKFLTKLADMEPKQGITPGSGERFSITINIPSASGTVAPITIDHTPVDPTPLPPLDTPAPAVPAYEGFRVPDFNLSPGVASVGAG